MKYYIWMRWESGVADKFEITEHSFEWFREQLLENGLTESLSKFWRLETPDKSHISFNSSKLVAHKLIKVPETPGNPLEDEEHYENPTN